MSVVLATPPFLQFEDSNGNPLGGGLIYTYAAGTSTPKATYTDQGGLTPMSNPIVLDSAGRATWWITGAYKYIVKDSLGNTIATTDNVTSFSTLADAASAFFQSFSGDGSTKVFTLSTDEGTDSKGLMVFVSSGIPACVSNGTFATDTIWTKGAGWTIGAGVATATGAISTAISQSSVVTLIQGQAYSVTYTMTVSAGTLAPSIGGQAGTARSVAGTYMETIVAGSSQTIAFTGAGFTGTLDNVTVNIASPAGFEIQNPSAYTIAATTLTFATAPATGSSNIFVFAPSSLLGAASSAAALAQTYATAALTSETNAATSATNASTSATAAASSATSASSSATTATTQASNASTSATAAASSATSASSSATAAAASAVLAASTLTSTSVSSNTIGTGAFTFTTQASKQYQAGQAVIVADSSNAANFIFGTVTSYSGTTLIINGTKTGGSGTKTSWNISVSGIAGADGSGTVTTSGSPATGNLTKFSSSTAITNADLTGDVTTSGTVATTIANNAITLAKLATQAGNTVLAEATGSTAVPTAVSLTTQTVLGRLGGNITAVGVGTSANNLVQLDGSSKLPAVDGSALTNISSPLVLLGTGTASNSASLAFTSKITSTYDNYFFVLKDIRLASASYLWVQTSVNNSTYDSSGNHYTSALYNGVDLITNAAYTSAFVNSDNGVYIAGDGTRTLATSTDAAINGTITLYNPNSTVTNKIFKGNVTYVTSTSKTVVVDVSGYWGVNGQSGLGAINAVRFIPVTGNITSGTIYMYGIKNS